MMAAVVGRRRYTVLWWRVALIWKMNGKSWCVRVRGDYRCRGTNRKEQERDSHSPAKGKSGQSSPVSFTQLSYANTAANCPAQNKATMTSLLVSDRDSWPCLAMLW